MRLGLFGILVWGFLQSSLVMAEALTIPVLVDAIASQHPSYLSEMRRTEATKAGVDEAVAAFDMRVSQMSSFRTSGYYDGAIAQQQVSKPLALLNAEISATYRISSGDFPVYESEFDTLNGGELGLGLKLSLLQNRDLDKRRTELADSESRLDIRYAVQQIQNNAVVRQGIQSFLRWKRAQRIRQVTADLLRLTESRLKGVEERVASGDLAAISVSELQTTLLQRKILLTEVERSVATAREQLAFYLPPEYRLTNSKNNLNDFDWPYALSEASFDQAKLDLDSHPALIAVENEIEVAMNALRLAENQMLPELDLTMKVSRDLGAGDPRLRGADSAVLLNFEVPVGRRAARATSQGAQARIHSLDLEKDAVRLGLTRDIEIRRQAWRFGQQLLEANSRAEEVASHLLEQETKRFEEGIGDQFILISREAAALEAKVNTIEAEFALLNEELLLVAAMARLVPQDSD